MLGSVSIVGREGRALGLVHATNGLADFVASALAGGLWTVYGARPAFGVAAVPMALGFLLTTRVIRGPSPR